MFEKNINYTDFTNKNKFIDNIKKIIKISKNKTKYFAISLNNNSKPSYQELINHLKDNVSKIYIHKREHIYKVTGKENKQKNYEVLLVLEV